jgi:CTP synthase (UTP-ammonia lyase)
LAFGLLSPFYGVNQAYEEQFQAAGLRLNARGLRDETRAVKLPGPCFFIATLFQPQLSSRPEAPHRLWVTFLWAAIRFRRVRP